MKGAVHGKGRIEIKKDGSVNGDLTAPHTIIEDGEYFKGSIEIEKERGKGRQQKPVLADASAPATPRGARGVEAYLIAKECLGSYAQDRDNKWFAEFGCSHLKSGEAGYMFPFVVRCAISLLMHRAKGVRP